MTSWSAADDRLSVRRQWQRHHLWRQRHRLDLPGPGNDFIWTDNIGSQSTDYIYEGVGTGVDTIADFTPAMAPTTTCWC